MSDTYLLTITDEYSEDWKAFKDHAKKNRRTVADLLRETIKKEVEELKPKKKGWFG
tara:strand:+ start:147 stop:314 length:168 start_codon:yes stop_codon:yes gene_type:complete